MADNSTNMTTRGAFVSPADHAILKEIGKRIAAARLGLSLTQADLAEQAGLSKRTIERIEAGASAQLSSLVRILRVLQLLPGLELLFPEPVLSPIDLLKLKGKERQRASSTRQDKKSAKKWSWADEGDDER